jgi:hypothetical protein
MHWIARDASGTHHKGFFMFHKNVLTSLGSISPQQIPASSSPSNNRIALDPNGSKAPHQKPPEGGRRNFLATSGSATQRGTPVTK